MTDYDDEEDVEEGEEVKAVESGKSLKDNNNYCTSDGAARDRRELMGEQKGSAESSHHDDQPMSLDY